MEFVQLIDNEDISIISELPFFAPFFGQKTGVSN
jgi:hypothetical protein